MTGYTYIGACGAYVDESWYGNTQVLQCSKCHGMNCSGGCSVEELCRTCEFMPEDTEMMTYDGR